jgi:hypothetical protein
LAVDVETPENNDMTEVSDALIPNYIENMRVDSSCSHTLLNGWLGIVGHLLFKPAGIISSVWGYILLSGFLTDSGYGSASTASRCDLQRYLCRCFNLVAEHPAQQ